MVRQTRERKLEGYIDKGDFYWEDYLEVLKEVGSGRINMFYQKSLHPEMMNEDGYTRVETWSEGKGDDAIKYKANVKFDKFFVVHIFSDRYSELGLIDGAHFARERMDKITDMIQDDHSKIKEKEISRHINEAASALVRAGLYNSVDEALQVIRSNNEKAATIASNGRGKGKTSTTKVDAAV